jgi:CRISPR-associated endonuclease/helicase Cas3
MPPPYYAHSGSAADFSDWQTLANHLRNVAERARRYAAAARPNTAAIQDAAKVAGLLHDLGKYRPEFQQYLKGLLNKGNPLTHHKQAGAAKAAAEGSVPVAFAVYGHHGGIPDKTDLEAGIRASAGAPIVAAIWPEALADCRALGSLPSGEPQFRDRFDADLFTRVLFSCLVDADWSDTGEHERQRKNLPAEPFPPPLDPINRLPLVLDHISARASLCPEPHIKDVRASVLAACLASADQAPGLFSLTVPTGGGKTLAGLAFALKHAAVHGLRRVIYVAPYMTILEQNAEVIRAALGVGRDATDVFEHYSLAEPPAGDNPDEMAREAAARRAENWDAPIIVTTNVQFFESLFSNKPGRCRKLHNIARSVIILDECQTLPPGLVAPTCGMLRQLAADLGCTVVLCTATQPAFDHVSLKDDERLTAREIIPPGLDLFAGLKRVHVMWPKLNERLGWPNVAEQMREERSALCVVNTKKAAHAVYKELAQGGAEGVFHLSTGMCPAHRREKLQTIIDRLKAQRPCYLVSTQLIEAGVDVDFPFVLREMAPLESIIQTAGRCNREGRIPGPGGHVLVFRSVEGKMPPDRWYNAGRDKVEQIIAAKGTGPQIDDPAAIRDYFGRLFFSGTLDGPGIQPRRRKFQFKSVAESYRLIDDTTEPVVMATWEPHRQAIGTLLAELQMRPRKAVFRALSRYQVNLFPAQRLRSAHLIAEQPPGILVWSGKYDDDAGIVNEMADDLIV